MFGRLLNPEVLIPLLIICLVVFGGKGKISELMGDFAKGINSFKKGLKSDDESAQATSTPQPIEAKQTEVAPNVKVEEKQHVG